MARIYQTLAKATEFAHEERRSQFIALLRPVKSKGEFEEIVAQVKETHPNASHICTAYVLGNPEQAAAAGFNDDGEPSGTAGRPILNALMQRKVGDVVALVVRYFGGTKLGVGGLARAYGQAVSGALDVALLVDVVPKQWLHVRTEFAYEERLRHILQLEGITDIESSYSTAVTLHFECPEHLARGLKARLDEATSGRAVYLENFAQAP